MSCGSRRAKKLTHYRDVLRIPTARAYAVSSALIPRTRLSAISCAELPFTANRAMFLVVDLDATACGPASIDKRAPPDGVGVYGRDGRACGGCLCGLFVPAGRPCRSLIA